MLRASGKRFVAVTWRDAHGVGTTAYSEHEIPHKAVEICTFGWELRTDTVGVSLVNEICADGTFRGYTFIPAELVVSVEPIPVGKTRKAAARSGAPGSGVDTLP